MSLKDAVLTVVEDMKQTAAAASGSQSIHPSAVDAWALALKVACTAAPDAAPPVPVPVAVHPFTQHETEIAKAKAERRARAEEEGPGGEQMVDCVGGPLDGIMVTIPSTMPLGAKTARSGGVYVRDGNHLIYSKEETDKFQVTR